MKTGIFLVLYFGLVCTPGVLADNHEIKRGDHPYMAFIYFLDPSIVDLTGSRFIRSAILIRPDWLLTAALGPRVIDTPNGFPKQTLMARVGAISIDANITLNEEEFEQEREVVQVVRPFNNSATQWWTTDISLLKTLLPFSMTLTVGVKTINSKRTFEDKTCIILFYSQFANTTEKQLMQMFVDLMPSSSVNCGPYFSPNTMICASDSNENKNIVYDPNFCHGNSGGPLICENEIMGLQTYIENDCKQPHLYQLISTWDNFITCSIEDKCHEEQCANICDVTYKDPPIIATISAVANRTEEIGNISKSDDGEAVLSETLNSLTFRAAVPELNMSIIMNTTLANDISQTTTTATESTNTTVSKITTEETTEETTAKITEQTTEGTTEVTTDGTTEDTTEAITEATTEATTKGTSKKTTSGTTDENTEEETSKLWPRKKPTNLKMDMESDDLEVRRQEQVVAQLQKKNKKIRSHGSSQKNISVLLSLISGVMILVCY